MKKTLMVAALTGVFATAAHAQSSVTLYGLIDAGITYTNNQHGHSRLHLELVYLLRAMSQVPQAM